MAGATVRRAALRTLLSLPSPVLRLMAGGGAVYRGGRTLDPRMQLLAAMSRGGPAVHLLSPEEAARATGRGLQFVAPRPPQDVAWEPHVLPGPTGDLAARLYRSRIQDARLPVLVFAHFGGGLTGGLECAGPLAALLAETAGCPVLAVDYAQGSASRLPGAMEDLLAAFGWARANAERLGAPAGLAAIGGESIGANLAAVVTHELKRKGQAQPAAQLLVCPLLDLASEAESMSLYADAFPLSRPTIEWAIDHYLGPAGDPTDARVSPLRSPDLAGLAPAVIATAGFDPLVDQGLAYARALREAGVDVAYRCYDSLTHGFPCFAGAVPAAQAACLEIGALLRGKLEDAAP